MNRLFMGLVLTLTAWGMAVQADVASDLTRNLPGNYEAASAAFSSRLAETFPDGTPVSVVVSILEPAGYVMEAKTVTRRSVPGLFCQTEYIVIWELEGDQVRGMHGLVGGVCM
jgi:hypothetical protein